MNARRDIDLHDPDMTLLGGTIVTVDQNASVAEALAIRDGRISAIGSSAAIRTPHRTTDDDHRSRRPHRHPWPHRLASSCQSRRPLAPGETHRWMANLRILEINEIKTVVHVAVPPFVER